MIIDIGRMEPKDFTAAAGTVCAAWRQAYKSLISPLDMERYTDENRRAELYKSRYSPDWEYYKVTVDGQVRGVCSTEKYDEKGFFDAAIVHQLYIHPDFQRMGLGRKLLSHTLRGLRAKDFKYAVLFVMEGNAPAIGFYEKFGFEHDGCRQTAEGLTDGVRVLRYRIEL